MEVQMSKKKGSDIRHIETKIKRTEIQENESDLEYESEEFEIEVQYDNPTTNTDISGNDKIYMHGYNDEQLEQLEDKLESELDEIDQESLQLKSQDQFSENNEVYSENYENDQFEDSVKAEHGGYTNDERQTENNRESQSNDDQTINIRYDKVVNNGKGNNKDSANDYGDEDDTSDGKEDDKVCDQEENEKNDTEFDTEDDKEADKEVDKEDDKIYDKIYGRENDDNTKETKNDNNYLIEELWKSDLDDDYEDDNSNDLPFSHIPVYIDLGADVFKLFQPNCEEDEDFQDLGILFPSSTILLSPLSVLFEDLRKFINDEELGERGELELKIKDLDNLIVNEDSICCKDLSMNNLLMMYESLRENSENKDLHKFVQVELHRKWGIVDRIRDIENAINKGGSLDSLSRILKRGYGSNDEDGGGESKIKRTKL